MKLLIDIDESIVEHIKDGSYGVRPYDRLTLITAVLNGTPLPKGHGDLIDRDELYLDIQTDEEMRLGEHLKWVKERFDNAPTIIEADNAESEDKE